MPTGAIQFQDDWPGLFLRGDTAIGVSWEDGKTRSWRGLNVANAYRAIVHSWDNSECVGDPQEWQTAETFDSEDRAMTSYRTKIRPRLERLMAEACRKVKEGTFIGRRLE